MRFPRHAFACLFLSLFGALLFSGAAQARAHHHAPRHWVSGGSMWQAPVPRWEGPTPGLRTDDGGRLAGVVTGASSAIVAEASRFIGSGNPTGTGYHNWCADYASFVLARTGHRRLANRMAAAGLSYGPHTSNPRPGDLAVMNTRAGFAHHIGFFGGWAGPGRFVLVSGNYSHRVARSIASLREVAAFVRV